jgi:hypothetical protein
MKTNPLTYRQELNKLAAQNGFILLNSPSYMLVNQQTNEVILIEKLAHAEIELKQLVQGLDNG